MRNFLMTFANILMVVTSLFLICLVLIQRGKGGGLAGAFGGAGGSSAFGTKAGDVFTRITIITAGFWFLLALLLVYSNNMGQNRSGFKDDDTSKAASADADSGGDAGTGKSPSPDKGKKGTSTDLPPAIDPAKPPTSGAVPPAKTPAPAQPLNPADAGMKPTTDAPPPAKPKS